MTNIFVGNLSYDATEDDIRDAFAQHGEVSSVNVITDRDTGRPRGFAFVEMPNDAEAQTAIESLNQSEIRGRAVNVNVARPKADRPRRGGGGGGGRGGFGGGGGGGGGGGRRGGGGGGRW
ncbi:MAG: RNA recognition motif domain-containing protein [Planctomycetota bacterium]